MMRLFNLVGEYRNQIDSTKKRRYFGRIGYLSEFGKNLSTIFQNKDK